MCWCFFRMTQWDRLRQLPAVYTQHLHELYDRDTLPMDVRHYLAAWIEKQEWWRHTLIFPLHHLHHYIIMSFCYYSTLHFFWNDLHVCYCLIFRKRAAQDYGLAMVLFQVLLENLDIQHSRFVQEESFLMQHNIRRYKQNFQVCMGGICRIQMHRIKVFLNSKYPLWR